MQLQKYNIIAQSVADAQYYANKAIQSIVNEGNEKLKDIVTQMIERTF